MRSLKVLGLFTVACLTLSSCNTGNPVGPEPLTDLRVAWQSGGNTLAVGDTLQLRLEGDTTDGTTVNMTAYATWSSEDESIATVSESGLVTAVSLGQTRITSTYLAHEVGASIFVQ